MVGERHVPLLDLQAQHRTIREEVLAEVTRVIDSQKFILGEEVEKLELSITDHCDTAHAIGCASGSDALVLALLAAGIQRDDEVLTTPYTFFATAGSIHRVGARPVFVDIEQNTFNMDMDQALETISRRVKVRAVIPVHLFGACADMDTLMPIAVERGIYIIEDAAQSIGAEYKGRKAGSMGQIGCFSFFPSKNLGGYGDGGLLSTNDNGLAERLRALRVHGSKRKYVHDYVGVNSRLDALQAAVLRVKLRYLDNWTAGRQRNADHYRRILSYMNIPVNLPEPSPHNTKHVYNQFVIRCERRDELQAWLLQRGIGTEVYYPIPLHLQKCFAYLGYRRGDFPISEQSAAESLSLPIYPELPLDDIEYICGAIEAFYAN